MRSPIALPALFLLSGMCLAGICQAGAARAADGAAQVMTYSDPAFQKFYTQTVINPFNRQGGLQAQYTPGRSSAEMLGNLRTQKTSPQLDVVIMDTTTAAIACKEGLVEPITAALVPELGELDPQAVQTGNGCGPGVTFDHLVIYYDAQAVSPAPASLAVLDDPAWKGKVGLGAPPNIQGLALTAVYNHAATGDWRKADAGFAALRTLAPQVQTFEPQPDGYTLIQQGVLDFCTGWNARSQFFHDQTGGRIGVMLPKEGTVLQINTINVVKNAPHRDAALAFMRHALSAPAQAAFAEALFYAPTNTRAQVRPDVAARLATSPENRARIVDVDWNEMVRLRDNWTQRWRREVIANGGR